MKASSILDLHGNPYPSTRSYQAAGRGHRMKGYFRGLTSPTPTNAETKLLTGGARELVRNNGFARAGIAGIVNHMVGSGIGVKFKYAGSKKIEQRINDEFNALWGSPFIDHQERINGPGIQQLAAHAITESGRVLIGRRIEKNSVSRVPLQLEVLESDFHDITYQDRKKDNIIDGIEFDGRGKWQAIYLFNKHPQSTYYTDLKTLRVPKEEVIHAFRVDRPGQNVGVSWLASSYLRFKQQDELEDALLETAKIMSCFSAFVHDLAYDTESPDGGGGTDESNPQEQAFKDAFAAIQPGYISFLPPGRTITFANPPKLDSPERLQQTLLHKAAKGLGATYEILTGDMSMSNFSKSRLGMIDFDQNIKSWRNNMFIPQVMYRVVDWFLDLAAAIFNFDKKKVRFTFSEPKRVQFKHLDEVKALLIEVMMGSMTLSEVIRSFGKDPDVVFKERSEEIKKLENLGIPTSSLPLLESLFGSNKDSDK